MLNFAIPIIWFAVEPPRELGRRCVGTYAETFRRILIFYNVALICVSVVTALMNTTKAKLTANPIHVMLLGAAMYIPLQFAYPVLDPLDFALPSRTPFSIILGPAVGILASTLISVFLIILEPLFKAIMTSNEESLAEIVAREKAKQIQEAAERQESVQH